MRYKSHTALGLTFQEYGALWGTRAMLDAGVLRHHPKGNVKPDKHLFNMNVSCRAQACGSVSCIGGTMALIMGLTEKAASDFVNRRSYEVLFFPKPITNYDNITPAMAVAAIDNFLRTGKPNWPKARKTV